ncbi:hypothetical protein THRCLA_08911 [Thraustotheca clavata]|uniref:EF-hand domain-containing protein n=1 Tax=Thraustotheca clavata TaxID=74557 RepID=A0A1V9Z110_9STRA|nr:hypothetical protein THRCLA_08911 [Thraustotheca clavata]
MEYHHSDRLPPLCRGRRIHSNTSKKKVQELERELLLDEERIWMKNHKKLRKFEFTTAEKRILKQWFDVLDADHSGFITTEELQDTLLTLGLVTRPNETQKIVKLIDTDGSGTVDFNEFMQALMPQHDKNHDDIDAKRMTMFLGLKKSMEEQTKGLLEAKTHVSMERRRFLVDTLTSQKLQDIDQAINDALHTNVKKQSPPRPTTNAIRLSGLNDMFRRAADANKSKAEALLRLKSRASRIRDEAIVVETQMVIARRIEARSKCPSGKNVHLPNIVTSYSSPAL